MKNTLVLAATLMLCSLSSYGAIVSFDDIIYKPICSVSFNDGANSSGIKIVNSIEGSTITGNQYGTGYLNWGNSTITGIEGDNCLRLNQDTMRGVSFKNTGLTWNDSFSISMDLKSVSNTQADWTNIFAIGVDQNNNFRLQYTAVDNQIGLFGNGSISSVTTERNNQNLSTTDWSQFTFNYQKGDDNKGYFQVLLNGVLLAYNTEGFTIPSNDELTISLGNEWGGSADVYIDNFVISKAIPEPTSASLGLLGLGTLLLRRRRQA